jgi:hypothetical protein
LLPALVLLIGPRFSKNKKINFRFSKKKKKKKSATGATLFKVVLGHL